MPKPRPSEARTMDDIEVLVLEYAHLAPPESARVTVPRVCATCKWQALADGVSQCVRPKGPGFDAGDMKQWFFVCERWVLEKSALPEWYDSPGWDRRARP